MKIRACFFGLMALVSVTSGCACCDHPCWGWRLHPWSSPCGGCGCPAYSSPVVYRPATVMSGPDCPCNATPVISHPIGYPTPVNPYAPVIGNPMPLPGGSNPNPMPTKNQ